MKRLFTLLLAAACSSAAFCKDKIKAEDLTGSWKETARLGAGDLPLSFTDTIRIDFLIGNEYIWGKAGGYIYRGTFKVSGDQLDMGARVYTVGKADRNRMLLRDETGWHEFSRYTKEPVRTDNSQARLGDRVQGQELAGGVRSFSQMSGNWEVYKRTSAVQQKSIDYDRIIKRVQFSSGKDGEKGLIFGAKDAPEKPSWYVDYFKDNTLYCKGRDARTITVLRCAGGELILREGDVTYFLKQF